MDLSPEVYMMSMDEMSSTSSSPDHQCGGVELRGVLPSMHVHAGAQDYRVVHSSMHRCIPRGGDLG